MEAAMQQHRAGHLGQAKELYRLLLQRHDYNHPFALHALGAIAYQEERYDDAEAYKNMVLALQTQGQYAEANTNCRNDVRFKPDFAKAYNYLAAILHDQGQYAEAVENYRRALQLRPDYADAYNNLAITLRIQGKFAEAITNCNLAIRLKPHCAEPYYNLADAQRDIGRCQEAIANYDRAIQIRPDCVQAHWNKALALLLSGNLVEGWKAYELRRHPDLKIITYPHCFDAPRWDGSTFQGKTLFVHYEQGMGDTLQFVRYLPMVKDMGGTVILEARKPLIGLLRACPGIDDLVEASYKKPAIRFDFHASLMDLPGIFGTTLETIPSKVPYLHAASKKITYWKNKLAETGFKVGIVWAGSTVHRKDHIRSCRLEHFAPLAKIPGVRLYGLQKGPAAEQVEKLAGKVAIVNIAQEFEDFTDTAAAIANLDLVISVDTAVLHLAGAMAKPVWALLPFTPDWRWMLNRQDSPWYPTMRLFRQTRPGQWDDVFQHVAEQSQILLGRETSKAFRQNHPKLPQRYQRDCVQMNGIVRTLKTAVRHHQAGRLGSAKELYRLLLQGHNRDHPFILHALGVIAYQEERYDEAIELIREAIANSPETPQYHNTLGLALEALGRFEQAANAYRQAVLLKPDLAEAYGNMAIALQAQGLYAAAVEKCKQAVLLKPDYAEAYNTMGFALQMQGKYGEAAENYTRAVFYRPNYAEAYNHLAVVLSSQGRYSEAIENYSKAIHIDSNYAEAHWNLSLVLLLTGDLARGWQQYAWRRHADLAMVTYPHNYGMPRWDGSSFADKRILVHYEQGFGDTIQFIRYLPMVKARGGTVIFEARKPMIGLLRGFRGIDELVEASYGTRPAVEFDLHASVMDLPAIFGTTLATIPADVPYIHADRAKVEHFKHSLLGPGFKVGIVWAGAPIQENDRVRSCALKHFAPLAEIDGVKLYGLQKGKAAAEAHQLSDRLRVVNLAEQCDDFADTAAVIQSLDLVISVDTAVAHLAGAMAKPVWVLLRVGADWRWMLNRQDSPWYPTMRLFRQKTQRDWDTVLHTVAEQLQMLLQRCRVHTL
jgi:tetratricopeptide (TPR) repeat protein/ADP-heptose:LPS heptosyltransferase